LSIIHRGLREVSHREQARIVKLGDGEWVPTSISAFAASRRPLVVEIRGYHQQLPWPDRVVGVSGIFHQLLVANNQCCAQRFQMAVFGFRPEQGDIMSSNRTPLIQISATIARFSFRSSAFMLLALLVASLAPPLRGQTLTILYAFPGQPDGSGPYAPPIKDKHGNLYGTTYAGGSKDWGTVYEISASGKETVLHSFVGGKDGSTPTSGLIMDARGNLYGTTYTGGSTACFNGYGCGVVYKLSPRQGGGWKETILYAFKGRSDGGLLSFGDLTRDAEGNLYGTTM
jgi:uncharacterized repeat protein (TIGR03803 family)